MSTSTATAAPAPANAAAALDPAVGEVIEAYVSTFNETDPARRRATIARAWVPAARYRDPVMAGDGHDGLDAMLAGLQARFPGFVLKRTSKVDCHNGSVRFAWSLGPASGPSVVEGVDFCALAPDGRLQSVVGFFDKVPG
ncbi:MAG TPA: nuclear transport factor 2 family protein [Reyranella sp.]|jgi:hypothetical protein|nr:nuclear transport factor 2 family protein [Reyranella sp.]